MLRAFPRGRKGPPARAAQQRGVPGPPGPPLQANPQYDLASLGRRETMLITSYQWLSPTHEAARIPIDRAMAMVTGRSLDATPPASEGSP